MDFRNTDLNDSAFVLSDEILTGFFDFDAIEQLIQVIAHEAGHLLGLRHVLDGSALTAPFADRNGTDIEYEDQNNAETKEGQIVLVGETQNSFEELVRNIGLQGSAPLIESESFFDPFMNFFGFSVAAPDVTIYNTIAVVFSASDGTEGNIITSSVALGDVTDSGGRFVTPAFDGDQIVIIGQSSDGGSYDTMLSDGSETDIDIAALGINGVLDAFAIEVSVLSTDATPVGSTVPLSF